MVVAQIRFLIKFNNPKYVQVIVYNTHNMLYSGRSKVISEVWICIAQNAEQKMKTILNSALTVEPQSKI